MREAAYALLFVVFIDTDPTDAEDSSLDTHSVRSKVLE
jgi:hypothetical protein